MRGSVPRLAHRAWFYEARQKILDAGREVLFDSVDVVSESSYSPGKVREEIIYRPEGEKKSAIRVTVTGTYGSLTVTWNRVSVIWQGLWKTAKGRGDIREIREAGTFILTTFVVKGDADGAPAFAESALSDLLRIVKGMDVPSGLAEAMIKAE